MLNNRRFFSKLDAKLVKVPQDDAQVDDDFAHGGGGEPANMDYFRNLCFLMVCKFDFINVRMMLFAKKKLVK